MTKLHEIGGFFELELSQRRNWHEGSVSFNTLRNGLVVLIKEILQRRPEKSKIFLPRFLCPEVSKKVLREFKYIAVEFYSIDEKLCPIIPKNSFEDILYIYNVFGLSSSLVIQYCDEIIVDNAHAFYSLPSGKGSHALFSARKFFGVPDGAYVSTQEKLTLLPPEPVRKRAKHLFGRLDFGPTFAYQDYLRSERYLDTVPPAGMSNLSLRILGAIDYDTVKLTRQKNFLYLHEAFSRINELTDLINDAISDNMFVPYSYPLMVENGRTIRNFLNTERIFNPQLWAGIDEMPDVNSFEKRLANDVVHLPIDQRYGLSEMFHIKGKIIESLSKL